MAALPLQFQRAGLTEVADRTCEQNNDERLVFAAKDGDREAFGELYSRYARVVHGILLARVPRLAAEDLLQDVFILAMRRLASLRDAARFGAWLGAIARNRAADYFREARPTEELVGDSYPASATTAAAGTGLGEGLFFLEALRSLPEAYREPLILRFVEGMTGPEIAERMGLKHGSVRVNLYRGMQLLRERLGRELKTSAAMSERKPDFEEMK
jgi:RNA polymerase sigma-70 factor (ECF subfamily)